MAAKQGRPAEYSEAYNKKALRAWNAWKEVCWVDGIGKPLTFNDGTKKTPIGKLEYADMLRAEISKAFRRKIDPFRLQLEKVPSSNDCGNQYRGISVADSCVLDTMDFSEVFDHCISEYEHSEDPGHERYHMHHYGDKDHVRKAKHWKDFVWGAVKKSSDAPLKVIRGKLIGQLGVINQVVEDWLMAEYSCRIERDPKTGKEYLCFDLSADAQAGDAWEKKKEKVGGQDSLEGSQHKGEIASVAEATAEALPNVNVATSDEGKKVEEILEPKWIKGMESRVDGRDACLLFAFLHGIKFYDDREILEALGIGKTRALELQGQLVGNLRKLMTAIGKDALDAVEAGWGSVGFVKWIERRALAEKAGPIILYRVREKELSRNTGD